MGVILRRTELNWTELNQTGQDRTGHTLKNVLVYDTIPVLDHTTLLFGRRVRVSPRNLDSSDSVSEWVSEWVNEWVGYSNLEVLYVYDTYGLIIV